MGRLKKISSQWLFRGCLFHSIAYFVVYQVQAAPHPASGSSALVSPQKGLYLLSKGFSVKTANTGWEVLNSSADGSQVSYHHTKNTNSVLSLQTEALRTNLKLEDYAKRWMKDYSFYGFDVLGTKVFTLNGQKTLVVDLLQKKKKRQLRQVLYLKDKKVVVLTCQGDETKFSEILSDCNQVAKSFEWADFTRQKAF